MKITDMKIAATLSAVAVLAGCVKDDIYNTDHPDEAKVTIITDWMDRGDDVDKPSSYTIWTAGYYEEATLDRFTMDRFFFPGNHIFQFYNNVPEIPVTNGIARVNTVPSVGLDTFIEPLPGWLFTGTANETLEPDQVYNIRVAMHQQVRQLTLILEPEGNGGAQIESINATLTGVCGEWDIAANTPAGNAMGVAPEFRKQTGGKWAATVRLLGIMGSEQKLTLTVRLSVSGPTNDVTLESDMSGFLAGFNSGKKNPLAFDTKLTVETDVEVGFTATIKDWERTNPGGGIAN